MRQLLGASHLCAAMGASGDAPTRVERNLTANAKMRYGGSSIGAALHSHLIGAGAILNALA